MYYIASCSFGKDSLAMVLRLIEENRPLGFPHTLPKLSYNCLLNNLSNLDTIILPHQPQKVKKNIYNFFRIFAK